MTNPAIQNDFSYYRRTLSRMRINNVPVNEHFELGGGDNNSSLSLLFYLFICSFILIKSKLIINLVTMDNHRGGKKEQSVANHTVLTFSLPVFPVNFYDYFK